MSTYQKKDSEYEERVPQWIEPLDSNVLHREDIGYRGFPNAVLSGQDVVKLRVIQIALMKEGLLNKFISLKKIHEILGFKIVYVKFLMYRLTQRGLVERYYLKRDGERREGARRRYYRFGNTSAMR